LKNPGIYVVAYDFSNNRLRCKISKLLENYGRRIQKSVFQCFLSLEQVRKLKSEASSILKRNSNSILSTDSIIIVEDIKENSISEIFLNNCSIKDEKVFY